MLKRTTVLLLVLALAVSLCACSSTRENAEGQSSVEGSSTVDAAGAPSATEACTQYLEAVAAGNWERFTEVTGDKPTADELIDIRESLFDTTRPSTILKIFRLDVVRESGPTSVYEPLVVQRYGLGLRGLTIGVRRTRNGGWAVVSASPREVGKTEIAELKDELDAIPYAKPVIYLYPERPTDVEIRLDVDGTMQRSVPPYDERTHGWSVMADPSGRLTEADGRVY
ncbi:MAG: hypothetical protein U1E22_11040, partial [Coriobacteriia bacterium]|nr:hypothetical protein [Coriobacteriia bacterium]